ncbi:hypothetical protein WCLP8_1860005 [uncultured Gammaproteobacteria bacterium]
MLTATDEVRFLATPDYGGVPGALTVRLVETGGGPLVTGSVTDLTTADAVGGHSHISAGTVAIATTVVAAPEVGYNAALGFDGSGHVDVAKTAALAPVGELTLEAWVQFSGSGEQRIIDGMDDSNRGYQLSVDGSGHAKVTLGNGTTTDSLVGAKDLMDGSWHHLAATYDNATLKIYTDGALDAHSASDWADKLGASLDVSLVLGRDSAGIKGMNGALDEVSIWSQARNATQVATDMSHGQTGSETGLVGYWKFDETSGTSNGTARHLDLDTVAVAHDTAFKGMVLGFDPADHALTYGVASDDQPSHGTLALSGNTYTYTPTPSYTGDDSFLVNVSNGTASVAHTVTLHVA